MPVRNIVAAATLVFAAAAHGASGIQITEWMYNGAATGEFIEFSNFGPAAVDFAAGNYSFDDDSRTPGVVSLAAFGVVQPGESVVLAEADAASFRAAWGLSAAVKVIGGNTTNLGRNDEINIYSGSTLIDRLSYGDTTYPGTIRTLNTSGRPGTLAVIGANTVAGWAFSTLGDADGARRSTQGDLASPGYSSYAAAVVPEPGTWALMAGGLALLAWRARRAG